MKKGINILCACSIYIGGPLLGQSRDVAIVGELADGSGPNTAISRAAQQYDIRETNVRTGVDGNITVHRVKNPYRAQPTAKPSQDSNIASISETPIEVAGQQSPNPIIISATVVDRRMTLLKWWQSSAEYQAWSNVDFNYLTGFSQLRYGTTIFALIIAVTNVDSSSSLHPAVQALPQDLPAAPIQWRVVSGDLSTPGALDAIAALHALYGAEGTRLIQAYEGRQARQALDEAETQSDSAAPNDFSLHYWKVSPTKEGR